jgi:hypothetical protein
VTAEPETALRRRLAARPLTLSVPKVPGQANEDAWQHSHKGVAALSDGASISFDSASWSRILVRHYARNPRFDGPWLAGATTAFGLLHDREALPWMQQAAFDRGSFASLVGLTQDEDDTVHVFAIGDSIAVLCDGDRIVASFPYDSPEQFAARPQLVSTNPAENAFLDAGDPPADLSADWDLDVLVRPSLLCMTDALGHWVLSRQADACSPVAALRGLRSRRAFERFVLAERETGRMRRDDTTLLAYWDL